MGSRVCGGAVVWAGGMCVVRGCVFVYGAREDCGGCLLGGITMGVWCAEQVVSEDGKKLRRAQPLPDVDLEEVQVLFRGGGQGVWGWHGVVVAIQGRLA